VGKAQIPLSPSRHDTVSCESNELIGYESNQSVTQSLITVHPKVDQKAGPNMSIANYCYFLCRLPIWFRLPVPLLDL